MATEYLFSNNATTTLAQALSSTATVINVASGDGSLFPNPGLDQAFAITLVDAATGLINEICYCTSRSGDQLTVTRGEEGTNSRAWLAGDTCANYITADVIESWLQESDLDGYATEAWSKEQFLQLADTETQTVTGPVTFSGTTTVPDVSAFTGKNALNAETAEGRYVKSVPTTGQTRITGLVENSDGRAVFGDGTNNPVLANLADLPLADPSRKIQAFIANVSFSNGVGNIVFPTAFAAGEIPIVVLPNVQEYGGNKLQALINIQQDGSSNPLITNTGATLYGMGWNSGDFHALVTENTIPVIAIGKM